MVVMDFIHNFTEHLYKVLLNNDTFHINGNLVKKHNDNLLNNGDFSFPIDNRIWKIHMKVDELHAGSMLKDLSENSVNIDNLTKKLINESSNWYLNITSVNIEENRCILRLNRQNAFKATIAEILCSEHYGKMNKKSNRNVYLEMDIIKNEETVTDYRMIILFNTIKKLLEFSEFTISNNKETKDTTNIFITNKTMKKTDSNRQILVSGQVIDPKNNNKSAYVLSTDYINKRSTDMQLMAQHKYGIRVNNDCKFLELIKKLGLAAVCFDFLEIKHSSPVGLHYSDHFSSKGASFILYNSARLETLFRTFKEKVNAGYYPDLPEFSQIDVTLLKEEEEWSLFFNYILEFPDLIKRTINDLTKLHIQIHLLCKFLLNLVGLFSQYYRRVRILTENRQQLLPVMYARLYLLKCLQFVFNQCLYIINIEPITQM